MAEWSIVGITLLGAVLTISLKFGAIETRVEKLERSNDTISRKLDRISDSLARIEGYHKKEAEYYERNQSVD